MSSQSFAAVADRHALPGGHGAGEMGRRNWWSEPPVDRKSAPKRPVRTSCLRVRLREPVLAPVPAPGSGFRFGCRGRFGDFILVFRLFRHPPLPQAPAAQSAARSSSAGASSAAASSSSANFDKSVTEPSALTISVSSRSSAASSSSFGFISNSSAVPPSLSNRVLDIVFGDIAIGDDLANRRQDLFHGRFFLFVRRFFRHCRCPR